MKVDDFILPVCADSLQMSFGLQPALARLRQSAFVRNVLVIMSGTVIAQAIGFAVSPVISRLFSPADFGVFGSFNAVVNVITAGVTLEYAQAVVLPRETATAVHLFVVSIAATLAVTLCLLCTCLLMPGPIKSLISSPRGWLLGLLVVAVLVGGLNQTLQAWCVRAKAFKQTSSSQVIRSISANGIQLGLGWGRAGSLGLVFASILGDALASINLGRVVAQDLKEKTTHPRRLM